MKSKKRNLLTTGIAGVLLLSVMSSCGSVGYNRRDGTGPKRDGSGGGPCSQVSSAVEEMPMVSAISA